MDYLYIYLIYFLFVYLFTYTCMCAWIVETKQKLQTLLLWKILLRKILLWKIGRTWNLSSPWNSHGSSWSDWWSIWSSRFEYVTVHFRRSCYCDSCCYVLIFKWFIMCWMVVPGFFSRWNTNSSHTQWKKTKTAHLLGNFSQHSHLSKKKTVSRWGVSMRTTALWF